MAWEVLAAGLGATLLTGLFSYLGNRQNHKATEQRVTEENRARLAQLQEENLNQLLREAIQRRTEFRREQLVTLQEALRKLFALSARYRHIALGMYWSEVGEEVPLPQNPEIVIKQMTEEIWSIRREIFGPYTWSGISSPRLMEQIRKLNRLLGALEREAGQKAELLGTTEDAEKEAERASKELDGVLMATASLIEELISGVDLVLGRQSIP